MFTDRELQQFIRGEIREQGWKSSWRVGQEKRRLAEGITPERIVAKQVKLKPAQRKKLNTEPRAIAKPKYPVVRPICPVKDCWRAIYPKNVYGLCSEHRAYYYPLIHQPSPLRSCAQCNVQIRAHNKNGVCRKHYVKIRNHNRGERRKVVRAMKRQLKEAA